MLSVAEAWLRTRLSLGIHAWVPHGPCKAMHDVTAQDVQCCIESGSKLSPPRLVDLRNVRSKLPLDFHSQPPRGAHIANGRTFPNAPGPVFPLHTARRTLPADEFESIEFLLGGAELDALASQLTGYRRTDNRAHARLVATKSHGVIVLTTLRPYFNTDGPAVGAQFENLLTGHPLERPRSNVRFEHVRLVEIGGGHAEPFTVLLSGECDALDETGRLVESKSGNPKYFGQRTTLQLVASACASLVYADRARRTLQRVHCVDMESVLSLSGPLMSGSAVVGDLQQHNIRMGLQLLRSHFAAVGAGARPWKWCRMRASWRFCRARTRSYLVSWPEQAKDQADVCFIFLALRW